MDFTTETSLLTLTATATKNTILVVSGLIATLILPLLLTAHLRLYTDTFASSRPAWFAFGSLRADVQRSEGLTVTLFMGGLMTTAAYAGAMAFFLQDDVNRGLGLDFAKASGRGVGLFCGVEIGVCAVYAVLVLGWRGFWWVVGGSEAVVTARPTSEVTTKAISSADKTA